jgi:hypothetical protein
MPCPYLFSSAFGCHFAMNLFLTKQNPWYRFPSNLLLWCNLSDGMQHWTVPHWVITNSVRINVTSHLFTFDHLKVLFHLPLTRRFVYEPRIGSNLWNVDIPKLSEKGSRKNYEIQLRIKIVMRMLVRRSQNKEFFQICTFRSNMVRVMGYWFTRT